MIRYIFILSTLTIIFSSCNSSINKEEGLSTKNIVEKSELFGWSAEATLELRTNCYDRFKKEVSEDEILNKENYCDCFVNKIISSINYEDHLKPNEKTIEKYDEFSKSCLQLNTSHEGVLYE